MTWLRQRWLALVALVAVMAALVGSIAVTATLEKRIRAQQSGHDGCNRPRRRAGGQPRRALRAADRCGQRWGLHVGEVMQFDNGFYTELLDSSGARHRRSHPPRHWHGRVGVRVGDDLEHHLRHASSPQHGGFVDAVIATDVRSTPHVSATATTERMLSEAVAGRLRRVWGVPTLRRPDRSVAASGTLDLAQIH